MSSIDDRIKDAGNLEKLYEIFQEEERHKKVKDAFKAIEGFESDANQNSIYNNILTPAFEEFYSTLRAELDKEFKKNDKLKLYGKKKELKKIFIEALKKYFEKSMPSVLEGIKGETDPEKVYKILTHQFSEQAGHKENYIENFIEGYSAASGDEAKTVGDIKVHFDKQIPDFKEHVISKLKGTYRMTQLAHIPEVEVRHYGRKVIEDLGHRVTDIAKFYTLASEQVYHVTKKGVLKGEWGVHPEHKTPLKASDFGIKLKSEPKYTK